MEWEEGDFIYGEYKNPKFKSKVASFDLDGTIIVTKSGKKFAGSVDDWKLFSDSVKAKFKELHEKDYLIVIFTNQKGIESKKVQLKDWKEKVEQITKKINVPLVVYASIHSDIYRKPMPTLFDLLQEKIKSNTEHNIDLENSFYCGDAAGRKNDFSDTDYKFALNCKISFKTPEDFFNDDPGEKPNIVYLVDFKQILDKTKIQKNPEFEKRKKEMIVMVGLPGSGKSTFASKTVMPHKYTRINRDILKTQDKCVRKCKEALEAGENVVIDNSCASGRSRKVWIDLAKQFGYKIRCIEVVTDTELSMHNALYRSYISKGKVGLVPKLVYNKFKKEYQKPSKKEGFDKIEKINFVPNLDLLAEKDIDKYQMYFF